MGSRVRVMIADDHPLVRSGLRALLERDGEFQVIAEAARVLAPGGRLLIVDLAPHERVDLRERLAHRVLGFSDADLAPLLNESGLRVEQSACVDGPLQVGIWRCVQVERAGARAAARESLLA